MVGVIWQNICSFIRLARQKIDWGLWFEGKLVWERWWLQGNNVSLTVQWRLPLTPGLRHDPQRLSRDKTWTFVPFTFGCFKCSYRKATRKGDMIGKEIHSDTLSSSFILSAALRCELGLSVCAPTEVQGNYWNIWMTGPSLNPRTNDAWPLQKGMGRTLLPLTDISHQRSMTSPTLVGWREAVRALETRLGKQIWHSWPQKTLFSQPTQRPELMLPMNISPKWQILLISLCPNFMLNFQFCVVTMLCLQSS